MSSRNAFSSRSSKLPLQSPHSYSAAPPTLSDDELDLPSVELYAQTPLNGCGPSDEANFIGKYKTLRTKLDYSYHKVPTHARQKLQDSIIDEILSQETQECEACHENYDHPVVLFTAGAMASGKGHTLRAFLKNGRVSLPKDFIWVDPDKIARYLPERTQYLKHDKASGPAKLHPEASMIQEVLCLYARQQRRSHVIDGSLSDGDWFKELMEQYRKEEYAIEIFFVFADEDVMERRAQAREKETGRHTSRKHIEESAHEAPRSVQDLAKREHVHRVRIIDNSLDNQDPKTCYDSQGDLCFEASGGTVDVFKWLQKGNEARQH